MAPLAEAFVRVRAETNRVRRDVNREFEGAGREGSRAFSEGFAGGGIMRNIVRALARSVRGVQWERAGGEAGREFGDGFRRDASGRLRDELGRFTSESARRGREAGQQFGNGFFGSNFIRRAAQVASSQLRRIPWRRHGQESGDEFGQGFTRDANGRLRDAQGRYVTDSRRSGFLSGRAFSVGFGGALRGIGKLLKLGSLAAGAGLATTNIVILAAELAELAGLLAGIPAAVAVGAAALGTLKLALSGVSDAFGAALGDDAEAFEESLQGLSPAAQSVTRELREVRPALMGIRNAAQQALFAPLQGHLRSTVALLAGPLKAGVRGVATEYGRAAVSVMRFAREGRTVSAVTRIFAGTRQVIAGVRPAMTPILRGFRDMAVEGVGTLTRLAQGAGDVGVRFGEWMQRFAASGGVQRALEAGVAVAKQLGGLLAGIGGILGSIIQAANASGGGLLGVLGQAVAQLNAFLKTESAQQAMTSFFATMNQLGRALAPIIPIIGQLAAAVISALMPVVQALTPVISQIVTVLGQTATALVPAFAPLGQLLVVVAQGLGMLVTALGPLLPALAAVISQLVADLVPILGPVIALIAQTAATILGALVQALIQCMPALQSVILAVAELLPLLLPLIPAWAELLLAIIPLVPVFVNLAAMLIGYLAPVLRLVIVILVKIITTVAGWLVPVLRLAVTVITWVASIIQPIFTAVGVAIQAVGRFAMWLWTAAIGPAFRGIAAVATWLWTSVIGPVFRAIVTVGKWLATAILVAVVGPIMIQFKIWATVIRWLYNAVIAPVFRAIATVVRWAINNVVRPVFNAFMAFIRGVLAPAIRWLYTTIVAPVFRAIGTAIRVAWNSVISPVFNALRSAIGKVGGAFRAGASAIKTAWDKIKGYTRSPVNFVIGTVYNKGIRGLWNNVLDWLHIKGMRLGSIPLLEKGGSLDNPAAAHSVGKTNKPMAIVGEGKTSAPEFVIPTDPAHRGRAQALWMAAGQKLQMLAGGGVIGSVLGGIRKAAGKVMDIGKLGMALLDNPKKVFDGLVAKLPGVDHLKSSPFGSAIAAIPKRLVGTAWGALQSVIAAFKKGFGGGGAQGVVKAARTQIGVPYVWGGTSWNHGLDCSGLTQGAWLRGGKKQITRTTYTQRAHMKTIPGPRPGAVGQPHSGHTYLASRVQGGKTWIVEAMQTGTNISEKRLTRSTPWWGWPPGMASGGALVKGLGDKFIQGHGRGWQIAKWLGLAGDPGGVARGYGPIMQPTSFDSGGLLQRGLSLVHNGTRKPERITTDEQWSTLMRLAERGAGRPIEVHNHALPGIPSDQQITSSVDKALIMHGGGW